MNGETRAGAGSYAYSLAWTSQFYFCALPFRLDSYKGCNFGCEYCFVAHRGGRFNSNEASAADASCVRRQLDTSDPTGVISECAQHRLPVHFGGMSDPFRHGEVQTKTTYSILAILAELEYPTVISTKSHLPAVEPYLSLLKAMRYVAVQFSFSTLDDDLATKLEPYAPRPSKRLRAMYQLSQAGLWVSCRFQPFITGVSGHIPTLVRVVAEVGARHIVVEHLKLGLFGSGRTLANLRERCGAAFDHSYDLSMVRRIGAEYELASQYKIDNLKAFWEETRRDNITMGVGDNDFHDLGDGPNCCGVDKLPGFENCFRHQVTEAVWRRDSDNLIRYSSIEHEWIPKRSIKRYINSKCRSGEDEASCSRAHEYLRRKWNNPTELHSPLECVNVVPAGFRDLDGNLVYRYEPRYRLD